MPKIVLNNENNSPSKLKNEELTFYPDHPQIKKWIIEGYVEDNKDYKMELVSHLNEVYLREIKNKMSEIANEIGIADPASKVDPRDNKALIDLGFSAKNVQRIQSLNKCKELDLLRNKINYVYRKNAKDSARPIKSTLLKGEMIIRALTNEEWKKRGGPISLCERTKLNGKKLSIAEKLDVIASYTEQVKSSIDDTL